MLNDNKVVIFLGSTNLDRSKEFYSKELGLNYQGQDQFALIFELKNNILRINDLPNFTPKSYTAIGWIVEDLTKIVNNLNKRGISMERYENFGQDEEGITTMDDGTKLAYFKDPDGNILSLTELP